MVKKRGKIQICQNITESQSTTWPLSLYFKDTKESTHRTKIGWIGHKENCMIKSWIKRFSTLQVLNLKSALQDAKVAFLE